MKKLLACISSFLIFAGGFSFPISALAQNASVASACSTQSLPVGYLNGTLIVKQNGDLCTNATGGGGGSSTVTATAVAPTYVEGSSSNPVSSDLAGAQRVTILNAAHVAVDWDAPAGIKGADGATIASNANPVPISDAGSSITVDGTVTANLGTLNGAATAANQTAVQGAKTPGTAATLSNLIGGVFTSGGVTLTDGQQAALSFDSSGRAIVSAILSGAPVVTAAQATASSLNAQVQGSVASGATATGQNPLLTGAVAATAPAAVTAGQMVNLTADLNGNLGVNLRGTSGTSVDGYSSTLSFVSTAATPGNQRLLGQAGFGYNGATWDMLRANTVGLSVQPYGLSGVHWNYAAASGGISNTTTAVTIKAAAGASVKNCITSIQIADDTLGAATELAIRDGAAGTVLWRTKLQTTALASQTGIDFGAALCGTANTLLEVVTLTASITGAVYINVQGFTGP